MEELDWSAETCGVTLNAEIEPKTHHQTPTICLVHMGPVILDQGSPNLFLEGQCPAEFSSNLNQTNLNQIIKVLLGLHLLRVISDDSAARCIC